jgi:hypothetical protein
MWIAAGPIGLRIGIDGPEPHNLVELNGWSSPQMLRRYGASARTYDRVMEDHP